VALPTRLHVAPYSEISRHCERNRRGAQPQPGPPEDEQRINRQNKNSGKKSYPTQDFLADHCVAYHCLQRFRQKNQTKNN